MSICFLDSSWRLVLGNVKTFHSSTISENIRVRFAPSPTGFLHLGGLRTLLYNYLWAKNGKGKLVLRIEDTDQNRLVPGSVEKLEAVMAWVGLIPDEGPSQGGPYGPYVQSHRLQLYRCHAQQLLQSEAAYRCFCHPELLAAKRAALSQRGSIVSKYDGTCRNLSPVEVEKKLQAGHSHVVRLKVPECCEVAVNDIVFGRKVFESNTIDDQILLKSDGWPTYHLASVVDDHLMRITHVVRGQEWLSSTPKHVLLYKAFGWETPLFAHLPLLVDSSGSKLSKRKGDVFVEDYKRKGYLPEAVLNLVGLLGWSLPGERTTKFLTVGDFIEQFSLKHCNRAPGTVDPQVLLHLQQSHLCHLVANKSPKLCNELRQMLLDMHGDKLPADIEQSSLWTDEYILSILALMCKRADFLKDIAASGAYYWCEPDCRHLVPGDPVFQVVGVGQFCTVVDKLEKVDRFERDALLEILKELLSTLNLKQRDLFKALRISLTGARDGCPVADIAAILGKKRTLTRLKKAVELINT